MTFEEFKANVEQWAQDRGIYEHSTALAQCLKAVSELGELADHAIKGDRDAMKDDIGDIAVCLVNVAKMQDATVVMEDSSENNMPEDLQECVAVLTDIIGGIASDFTPWPKGHASVRLDGAFHALHDFANRAGFTFEECCEHAWNEIKDRKGRMVPGGAFVKEGEAMSKNTGGPAFPESGARGMAAGGEGMTLRDYFAAKVMQGFSASPDMNGVPLNEVVRQAYAVADVMIKEREK